MKVIFTFLLISTICFFAFKASAMPVMTGDGLGGSQVVPNAYAATQGTGAFLGPLANAPRTYQLLIQASQLTDLVGSNLTGFNMRIRGTPNWPLSDVTYTNYDIYLSGSVEPSNRSLTFDSNVVGVQTQVRSGPLTILANSYPGNDTPNAFGAEITFNTPWLYSGGNLLVEIRHAGFTGTSRSTDALLTGSPGYGTLVSACWTGNYTGTSGTAGNFTIIKLNGGSRRVLKLTSFIEGRYNAATNSMVSDTTKVYLRNSIVPYAIVDSAVAVLDSNGKGIFSFLNAVNGVSYFIVVKHRNSIETWSDSGKIFTDSLIYDFSTSAARAYGNNLKQVDASPVTFAIFSGDVNQDGIIDAGDLSEVDNDAFNSLSGYVRTDVNGDNFVDASDLSIVDNNAFIGVLVRNPIVGDD